MGFILGRVERIFTLLGGKLCILRLETHSDICIFIVAQCVALRIESVTVHKGIKRKTTFSSYRNACIMKAPVVVSHQLHLLR